jgi:hypothetical protein
MLSLNAVGQYYTVTIEPNGTAFSYDPAIDLEVEGARHVTTAGVMSGKITDSGLAVPRAAWFSNYGP